MFCAGTAHMFRHMFELRFDLVTHRLPVLMDSPLGWPEPSHITVAYGTARIRDYDAASLLAMHIMATSSVSE